MSRTLVHCPSHTRSAFDVSTLPLIVRWCEEQLLTLKADAVLACGHSGLLVAGAVSYAARIPTIAIRKPDEFTEAHSGPISAVLPNGPAKRWVWLDDFISLGGTFRRCVELVWRAGLIEKPYPEAILEYHARGNDTRPVDGRQLGLAAMAPGFDWASAPTHIKGYGRLPA
jgi:hypothetical protein